MEYHLLLMWLVIFELKDLAYSENFAESRAMFSRRLMQHRERYRGNLKLNSIKNARRRNATCMGMFFTLSKLNPKSVKACSKRFLFYKKFSHACSTRLS